MSSTAASPCGTGWRWAMIDPLRRLFGPRLRVRVTILGVVDHFMVRWEGEVRLHSPATVRDALRAAGRAARADVLGAMSRGAQPSLLLNGQRLAVPDGLDTPVSEGAQIAWLMPMAGG